MPLTLYRYILGDLLRVLLLTTIVLALIIAFGASIRPLAEDEILGPAQVAKYIALALVPMLQFALPFAAGFAATMAFHRMACDNEFVAIAVGGISYPRILVPILALGVLLTALMVGLTQWVIPKFWGLLAQTVTRDVTDVFIARVQKGQPFTIGDTQIHADRIVRDDHPQDTGADTRLVLRGVAAAELDAGHRIVRDVTASDAVIDIYRREGETILKLVLLNTVVFEPETGVLSRVNRVEPYAVAVPGVFRTELRAMTRAQLAALRTDPEGYASVAQYKRELVDALYEYDVRQFVNERLKEGGRLELADRSEPATTFVVEADRLEAGAFQRAGGGRLVITRHERSQPVLRFECDGVTLASGRSDDGAEPWIELDLVAMTVTALDGSNMRNERDGHRLVNLTLPSLATRDLAKQPAAAVLDAAHGPAGRNALIAGRRERLAWRIERLDWDVAALLLQRYSLSATALLLVMLGAILAIWMRSHQPLTIYLCAFLPSILDLILISGGEQVMSEGALVGGATIMWSGNAIMVVVAVMTYLKLRQH
jgi:lipopolysaccharide export LptBFGC system permease protein LptF